MGNQTRDPSPYLARRLLPMLLAALTLAACGESDPHKEALNSAVRLMSDIVTSRVLIDAVRNADPQMHASTAASAALSGGITSNFRLPPDNIAILGTLEATQAWSVILKGDDENKRVIIEGYGENLQHPLVTKKIVFPPR
ncbi:hypothetical protein [uncultured Thiodictyon sp.]|uniref:hypothetical protein n=1 Tax=uncultured Thiodictyon sp. TaxID=1846217 RepID=UPI0025F21CC8|nr:hypothetical protein [uncultured Thiodictyon sp.]